MGEEEGVTWTKSGEAERMDPEVMHVGLLRMIEAEATTRVWQVFSDFKDSWASTTLKLGKDEKGKAGRFGMDMSKRFTLVFGGAVTFEKKKQALEIGKVFGLPLYLSGTASPFGVLPMPAWE